MWKLAPGAFLVLLMAAPVTNAADPLNAHFIGDVGAFFLSSDTKVRVDGQTTDNIGTDIDFDQTFGVGDFDRFRVDLLWRIAKRHSIRATYFQNNRQGDGRDLSRDVTFGDDTYPVGASVAARSDLTVGEVSYDYAFLRTNSFELGAGIGLFVLDMGLSLDASVTTPGSTTSTDLRQDASTTAPLPVVGLRAMWQLSPQFYMTAQAQYFYIRYDPYSGGLGDYKVALVWQPTNHVGVGVGYNAFRFHFDINQDSFNGRLIWNYSGAYAYASFMF